MVTSRYEVNICIYFFIFIYIFPVTLYLFHRSSVFRYTVFFCSFFCYFLIFSSKFCGCKSSEKKKIIIEAASFWGLFAHTPTEGLLRSFEFQMHNSAFLHISNVSMSAQDSQAAEYHWTVGFVFSVLTLDKLSYFTKFPGVDMKFCRILGESPKNQWKLCISRKFPYQEVRFEFCAVLIFDYH